MSKQRNEKDLAAGWVWDQLAGAVLQFEHMPHKQAERLKRQSEAVWVVCSINGTLAEDGTAVHYNRHYAFNLAGAVSMAADIEIAGYELVVDIRRATRAEANLFWGVEEHYSAEPEALTSAEAQALAAQRS